MSKFHIGDLVVLKSGSMRMCVEDVGEDDTVHTVWCNEGVIGRDTFNPALLNKWEHREDHRGGDRGGDRGGHRGGGGGRFGGDRDGGGGRYGGDRDGGGKPYGGDRQGGGKRYGGGGGGRDRDWDDDRPRKSGWDGKPRDKRHFRNDD